MVYCGKPSKGCAECRSRKIRCDQARPACSQCTKASRACSGYRDQLSLMFRDESQQVVRKANSSATAARRATKSSKRAAARAGTPASTSTTGLKSSRSPSLPQGSPTPEASVSDLTSFDSSPGRVEAPEPAMKPESDQQTLNVQPSYYPTQDEAVCYFLRYNAWPGAFWMLNATPDIFMQNNRSSSLQAMKAGVVSVGTGMLSRIRRCPSLKLAAEREYGTALRHMNSAVTDVVEARAHPTLAAVLLLAIFEVRDLHASMWGSFFQLTGRRSLLVGLHGILRTGPTISVVLLLC